MPSRLMIVPAARYRPAFNSKSDADAIEMCLDHFERDPIRGTYNHAEHVDIRFSNMQTWSDELDNERRARRQTGTFTVGEPLCYLRKKAQR